MCVLSRVLDYGMETWPRRRPTDIPVKFSPPVHPMPVVTPTKEQWAQFLEMVKQAGLFDKLNKQPDCEDPKKAQWLQEMQERMEQAEGR